MKAYRVDYVEGAFRCEDEKSKIEFEIEDSPDMRMLLTGM